MGFSVAQLPDFPWDTLTAVRDRAAQFPAGEIDLTIGSPVDSVPAFVSDVLAQSADAHSYPPHLGSRQLHDAIRRWIRENRGCVAPLSILPTLGEKEMIAMLPALLGLGAGDVVAFPEVAYPTYDVGARLVGAQPCPIDVESDPDGWAQDIRLLWLNSPSNPTGHVLSVDQLQKIVRWARANGVIVASDECYAAFTWEKAEVPSILDERVCDDNASGILMLYSLSKQSNLAGYRAGFIAGCPELLMPMGQVRKHVGMMLPTVVQQVMIRALGDRQHVENQHRLYAQRREILMQALPAAGLVCDPRDTAGLYLWVRRAGDASDAWELVHSLAKIGIIAAPGTFYGTTAECASHVRISLTASTRDIRDAAARLSHFS